MRVFGCAAKGSRIWHLYIYMIAYVRISYMHMR